MIHSHPDRGSQLRVVALLAGLVLLACGGSGSGGSSSSKKPLLVAIYKSGTQQYFIDQATGFKAEATQLGADTKVYDVALDGNKAVNTVNDAIAAGANGIGITVPDQKIGPAVARAAKDAKIPLVATDDAISDSSGAPVPFVGFDGRDMGTKVGQEAGKELATAGWLKDSSKKVAALVVEAPTVSVIVDRTTAEREQLKNAGMTADQLITVPYSGETDSALQAAGPVLTAHPQITNWVVVGGNDEGVKGTLLALQNAGIKPDNVIGVGLGAYEACKPWAASQPSGFKSALYISGKDVGQAAAKVLYDNVKNGTKLPQKTIAKTTIVNKDNYKQVGVVCTQ
ncbi:MAG: substrate-binding domain-containing protein [Candidatus Dormibacteraeota bacterium]|uniref:substrate-binding domain-containing protein n=1 Tax=Candidatus Dormibacter sp. TaxID=2973982 RepID=UPI00269CA048|nr:substrate-binding domain-containing protein [Candidatus Dormibacteraeota bacterium]